MTAKSKNKPFQKYFCHAQIRIRDNEFCDVTVGSVDGQKFKTHKVIFSASSIFFKKLLVNNLYQHSLIFMKKIENESHWLHYLHLRNKLERNQGEPFLIFITRIKLFGLNERVIEEAR